MRKKGMQVVLEKQQMKRVHTTLLRSLSSLGHSEGPTFDTFAEVALSGQITIY